MTEPGMRPEWDQLSIETPELVAIELPVAGIGSRFAALLLDYVIWLAAVVGLGVLIALIDPSLYRFSVLGAKWATAIEVFIPFLLFWGYFTLFEAFWDGRTPGKRVAKIRVIQRSGRGIGLFESMTRNLLRMVVHEREHLTETSSISSGRTFTAGMFDQTAPIRRSGFDVAASGVQRLGSQ